MGIAAELFVAQQRGFERGLDAVEQRHISARDEIGAAVAAERREPVVQHAAGDLEPRDALLGAEDALEARRRRISAERRERVAEALARRRGLRWPTQGIRAVA